MRKGTLPCPALPLPHLAHAGAHSCSLRHPSAAQLAPTQLTVAAQVSFQLFVHVAQAAGHRLALQTGGHVVQTVSRLSVRCQRLSALSAGPVTSHAAKQAGTVCYIHWRLLLRLQCLPVAPRRTAPWPAPGRDRGPAPGSPPAPCPQARCSGPCSRGGVGGGVGGEGRGTQVSGPDQLASWARRLYSLPGNHRQHRRGGSSACLQIETASRRATSKPPM
jgi:hypothetical protein